MFDDIIDRTNSDSAKWQKYQDRDILPMWVADMDFKSPQSVIEALRKRIDHGIFGYGTPGETLVKSICAYTWRTYHWAIEPRWIVWLPGLVSGLNVVCRAIGSPGDSVLTTVPVYPPFLAAPGNFKRPLLTSRLKLSNQRWVMDFEDIDKSAADHTRLFILCNPHNPTGRVYTLDELTRLADICLQKKMVICSDEIHCDLVLEDGCHHIPMASISKEIADHTITLMAPSKTFNIPGLSCSFAIISNGRLRRQFKSAMHGIVPHLNVLGMAAAEAAYDSGFAWLASLKAYLRDNRDTVAESIARLPGMEMSRIEATYLAWIDVRNLPVNNPARWFEGAGVGLSDGREFDGQGFMRLNFGCPRAILMEALERIAQAVDVLSGENK